MDNSISNSSDHDNSQVFGKSGNLGNTEDNLFGNFVDPNTQKSSSQQLYVNRFEQHLNDTVIPLTQTALRVFEQSPDFASKMNLAFGDGFDRQPSKSKVLIDNLAQGKLIPIEILPSGQIQAKGAFGENKIYLSEDLFTATANPNEAVNVLLEEMGHYIDSQINAQDSAGDEGEIFAKLVQNQGFQTGELSVLKAEDDRGILNIDNRTIAVEHASLKPGVFAVDTTGKVAIDFLADAGSYHSEMAIFSLTGMENLVAGSTEFIKEAARRALSNSASGYVVISDQSEGAKFTGELGESNKNDGKYAGVKSFSFTAGDNVAMMLVPQGTIQDVFNNPQADGNKRPLFSIADANPNKAIQLEQLGTGTFGWEDLRIDRGGDADYNDIIFNVKGLTGNATALGELIAPGKKWEALPLAKKILTAIFEDNAAPNLRSKLAEDTGFSKTDRLSSNPEIVGKLTDDGEIKKFQAKFTEGGNFVDILSSLNSDGKFTLNDKELIRINGGQLVDGYYKLILRAEDELDKVSNSVIEFTLDRTAPDLILNGKSISENSLDNSLVGTFSIIDANAGDNPTYSLVKGDGDADNDAFTIIGDELIINNSPDFEAKSTYCIRVKTIDLAGLCFERDFIIKIKNVNEAPTLLTLSANTLVENSPANYLIGTFDTADPDRCDSHVYSLVAGNGDVDNEAFTIVENQLRIKNSPDFETKPTYSIRIRTTDAGGLSFEQTFAINITNVNEAPIVLTLSANTLSENSLANSLVGTLNTTDPDAGDSHTYSLVTGTGDTDNNTFTLVGKELRINNSPDFETKPTYSIRVRTTDAGGLSFEQTFTVNITNVNEAPINIALDKNSVLENAVGAVIGNITVTDPDAIAAFLNNNFTVSDNRFEVINNNDILQLKVKDGLSLDYEIEPKIAIVLSATDAGNSSLTYSKNFTIDVIDVDEKPPSVSALLANDTGTSNSDRLTLDPTIKGETVNTVALLGSLNGNTFVDLSKALKPDGSFIIALEQYELLTNGSFPDGNYNLVLKGKNTFGNESPVATVNFILDRTPPVITFDLAPESDKGVLGDRITTDRIVTLLGQTEPGLEVLLVGTQQQVIADITGKFTFTNVLMPVAGQAPFTIVTRDAAGNQGQVLNFLTREGVNGTPKITSNPVTVLDTAKGNTYTYQLTATDPDGDPLTYSLLNAPPGAEINKSGLISFTPTGVLQSSYDFKVEVSDGRGGQDTQLFKVGLPGISDAAGIIRGIKWNDLNKNGVRDNQLVQGANPDVIYVLDVSGSADDKFAGSAIGDLNGDSLTDTRLDAEIAAFIALNQQLIKQGLGNKAQVAIVVFSGSAANADMDLGTPGIQLIVAIGTDGNNNGTPDVEEILRSIKSGAFGVGNDTGTNPEAALQKVETIFTTIATKNGNGNVIFLTDGEQNRGSSVADEVARLKAKGFNLSAFGVGDDASLREIQLIAPNAIKFNSIDGILNAFGGIGEGSQSVVERGLAGVSVYLDSNNNGVLDSGESVQITAANDPNTPNLDETGQYEFKNLLPGKYTVREVIPSGFKQTFPVKNITQAGNAYADVILDFVSGGNAPIPLVEPYGSSGGTPPASSFNANGFYTVGSVNPAVVLGAPPPSPIIGSNSKVDWLALPKGSYVTVGFTNKVAIDGPGDDIFIRSFDPQSSANEFADVFVSSNGVDFKLLGTVNERGLVSLDLAKINFTEPVTAVRVKGVDNLGSSPGFDLIGVEILPSSIASPDSYTVELKAGQVVEKIDFGNAEIVDTFTVNYAPTIVSTSPTNITIGKTYTYQVVAFDRNKDPLKYSLKNNPAGLTIDNNGLISWTPTAIGTFPVEIEVDDSKGGIATQKIDLLVAEAQIDKEAPQIKISFNSSVLNLGETLNLQVQGIDNVGLTDLKLSINGDPLTLNPNTLANGSINTASIALNKLGVFEVLATAKDAAGNVGTKTLQIRAIDPTDNSIPQIQIISPQTSNTVTKLTDIVGTITDKNLEFYQVDYAPIDTVDLSNLSTPNSNWVTLSKGKTNVTNSILGEFDPNLLLNGNYVVRVTAQNTNGGINIQGITLGVSGAQKLGNYQLEQTDLSIPLAGIPIQIKRVYDTLEANRSGDFGYGWSLGVQDPHIQESIPLTATEKQLGFSGLISNPFTNGTKVYLTDPSGQRVGFTFTPTASGGLLGTTWTPKFTADPGVTETLSVDNTSLQQKSDGTFGLYLIGLPYNPSTYKLTTKEGLVYTYDQFQGLQTVKDLNGNTLTFDKTGITSSTGVKVQFVRDTSGRISDVIDPSGKKIHYDYDATGNLIDTVDRSNNKTQFTYDPTRQHYLKNVVDPLGNNSTSTEYDSQGRLTQIIDAKGNVTKIATNIGIVTSVETISDALGNPTTLVYDDRGNVIQQVDAQNGVIQRTYDSKNNLLSLKDQLGNLTTYTYDGRGNLLTQTNPLGQTKTYTYNALNQILTVVDAVGNKTTKTYDPQGNLLTLTDAAGKITKYTYDTQGNVATVSNPLNGVTKYAYDVQGHVTTITDALNQKLVSTYDDNGNLASTTTSEHTTKFTYDASGRPLTITDALGNVSKFEYNAAGEKTATIDALGRRTESTYNSLGQLTQILYADATTEQFTYDLNGRKISSTDRADRTTNYAYDSLGRLIDTIEPDNTPNTLTDNLRVRREYDADGRLTAIVDGRGNRTTFTYNAAGEQIATLDALGNKTTKAYNANGLLTGITDALNHTTQFSYDALGRAISTRYADGTSTINTLDDLGRVIAQTDQAGVKTQYSYDADGRLIAVIDPLNQRTEYDYDGEGNLISQKDASGNVTTYKYDAIKELVSTILPLGQSATKTYDAVGNLLTATDFNGQTTAYQYNTNNEVTTKKFADGTSLAYTYTPTFRQATTTGTQGITKYSYDERDRLILATQPDGKTIAYSYDAAGNKTVETTTAGKVGYSYDELNQLQTVTDPTGKVTTYTYNSVGDLTKTQFANGIQETRLYDLLDRLTNLQQTGTSNSIVSGYAYTLDATGKRTSETDADGHNVSYTYDSLGRLTQEVIIDPVIGNRTIQYTYNATGNRLTRADSIEGTTTYSYDVNDRLLTQVLGGQTTQYSYDNNGNTLTVSVNSATQETYSWDAQGKLTAATVNTAQGTQNTQYVYDANGNRVATVVNGVETRYLVDTNGLFSQVVEAYAPNGTTQTAYVRGLSLISQTQQGTQSFDLTDGLETVRSLTNSIGAVTDRYTYDAFGRLLSQQGSTPNTSGFVGEQFDPTTNTYNLRARNYDPNTGRFISQDTFKGFQNAPQSLQKYVYAQNNPVNFIDPSGYDAIGYAFLLKGRTSYKLEGKSPSVTEQSGAIAGGLTGFGVANLIFIGEILGIANKGGDVIAQWSSAVDDTEKKLAVIEDTLTRVKGIGVDGGTDFASGYVSGYGYDLKVDLKIDVSPFKFNVSDLAFGSNNTSKFSKITPLIYDDFKLKYGGFKQGSASGISYLRALNPNKK